MFDPAIVKKARKQSGLRQQDAAALINTERSNYCRKENGKVPFKADEVSILIDEFENHIAPCLHQELVSKLSFLRVPLHGTSRPDEDHGTVDVEFLTPNFLYSLSKHPNIKRYINIICDAAQNDDLHMAYLAMVRAVSLVQSEIPEFAEIAGLNKNGELKE